MSSPTDSPPDGPLALAESAERTPAARVTEALDVLDQLADKLRDLDTLRETVAELVIDNKRLRADNVRLSHALVNRTDNGKDLLEALKQAHEKARIKQIQVDDLLEESTELNSRVLELEELNGSMMSMYVSSFQLHATLDLDEVIRVVEEIVVNFIGAACFAVLLSDDDGSFHVAAEKGLDGRLPSRGITPKGVLAEVLGSRTAYVHTSNRPAREGVLAAVPLVMGQTCVGAVIIFKLLAQKDRLLRNDVELLSLLGGHAASAIVSSKLYAKADRKLKTLEGMISLLGGDGE